MGSFKRAEAFADIASRQLKAGDFQGAHQTARRAVEVARAGEGRAPQVGPLYQATEVLIRTDDLEGARRAIDSITWPPSAVDLLRTLARAETRRGDPARAQADWTRALKMTKENHQPITDIVEIQAEMGDFAAALNTVRSIEEGKRQESFHQVAVALARAGRLDAAVSVIEKIQSLGVRDRAWIDVVTWAMAP
jgi:hypothetical protein